MATSNPEDDGRKDIQCTACGEWMGWGEEYYDSDDNAYCPEHKTERY